jgi:hypothetical protein
VVEELDADNFRGFTNAAGHAQIGFTWRRITGRMVMNKNESPSRVDDCRPENVTRMGHRFVDCAMGDLFLADKTEAGIDEKDPDDFMRKVAHLRPCELINQFGSIERLFNQSFAFGTTANFESGGE